MKTKTLFFVGWLLTGMLGCSKETTTSWQSGDIKFYPQALEYLQVPANTVYTFTDITSGTKETVTVQSCSLTRVFQKGYSEYTSEPPREEISYPDHYYEQYDMTLVRDNNGAAEKWMQFTTVDPGAAYNTNYFNTMVKATMFEKNEAVWTGDAFCLPGRDESINIGKYTVAGESYNDVVRVGDDYSGIYWAKGIGIIKIDIHANGIVKSFELVPEVPQL